MIRTTIAAMFLACAAYAQPAFEVASIKPSQPDANGRWIPIIKGGPQTSDPGRWTAVNMTLSGLMTWAYNIKIYQLTEPDWMRTARFDIAVKMPAGITRDEFRLMLQNMMADRFKLVVHREQKPMPIYELMVAENGTKLKEWVEQPPNPQGEPAALPNPGLDKDGYPIIVSGTGQMTVNGRTRLQFKKQSPELIAQLLSGFADRPVIDATGLKGYFGFTLSFASGRPMASAPPDREGSPIPTASDPAGPTVFQAVQDQLGLKLVPKKGTIEMVVVDRMEKIPTEN
jgi:uncharacterized protein (TIGR03435 family)